MREYDLKKALSTGSYTRNSIKPQLLVAEDGEYRQGDILDANATMEVVNGTASGIDDKINDILGVDNGAVQELVGILSDSDTTTGILNELAKKANISDLETVAGDIPQVPTNVSAFTNDAGYLTQHQDISGKANSSDLSTVATSGSYNDLIDKPAAVGQVQSDWLEADTTDPAYIKNKPTIPAEQIQSDWNQSDTTAKDYIKNKPNIPTIKVAVYANGHEYVDLGLPSGTKWAKCNVGADSETGYGNYYGYGKGSTLYNYGDSAYSGTENPLALNADTAAQVMGGGWRTPTKELFEELLANTTLEWTTINNVYGTKLTASNNNYIFFPAAGWKDLGSVSEQGAASIYWSSTPTVEGRAYGLYLRPGTNDFLDFFLVNAGRSVRGVITGIDTLGNATQSQSGLMSSADKTKLDGLSTVATTGSYNDLTDKPTIPTKVSDLTNNSDFLKNPHISNGHEYVEIAGMKWATMNIGASSATDKGLYFSWGETVGYPYNTSSDAKSFSLSDYKYAEFDGSNYIYTKYNDTDQKTLLDLEDDPARVNWGGNWRMPTEDEFKALIAACDIKILLDDGTTTLNTTPSGKHSEGIAFIDKTDPAKYIIFPFSQREKDGHGPTSTSDAANMLSLWLNKCGYTTHKGYETVACLVYTNGVWDRYVTTDAEVVYAGLPVRPILDEQSTPSTVAEVAITGDYNDLINKPTIPLASWTQDDYTQADFIKNKPDYSKALLKPVLDIATTNSNGHDYIEFGGVKWATMNVGAQAVTDYGKFFQWGDTEGYTADQCGNQQGKKKFDWSDYKYRDGVTGATTGTQGFTKYTNADGLTQLEIEDDAVRSNWGGNWRMPTAAEFQALDDATDGSWTNDYEGTGVSGLILTDKVDQTKKIFFPAAGDCWYGTRNAVGTSGMYWSNSLKTSYVPYSYNLHFDNHGLEEYDNEHFRYNGFPVRGVLDGTVQPNQASVVAITGDYNDLVNKPIIRSESLTLNLSDQTSTITGANNSGRIEIVIYDNTSQNDYTVSISTAYKTVDGNQIILSVPAGCYGEVCYTNIGGTIFAKGIKQLANS